MHDERPSHDTELSRLEAQLAGLAPRARLDRDRLMFAAGQRAAARRLRIANRLLLATSVGFAVLAGVLVTAGRRPSEPFAAPRPAVDQKRLAASAEVMPATRAGDATVDSAGTSVALLDGPTQFRLMQLLGRDPDARFERRPEGMPAVSSDGEAYPPSRPRSLLKRYLESKPGRM